MSMWMMYLVMKLDDIQVTFGTIGTLLLAGLIVLRIIYLYILKESLESDEDKKDYKKKCRFLRKFYFIPVLLISVAFLMPDTKTGATLYVLPKVINNKQVRKMPNKLVMLANSWMDEQIKSVKDKT